MRRGGAPRQCLLSEETTLHATPGSKPTQGHLRATATSAKKRPTRPEPGARQPAAKPHYEPAAGTGSFKPRGTCTRKASCPPPSGRSARTPPNSQRAWNTSSCTRASHKVHHVGMSGSAAAATDRRSQSCRIACPSAAAPVQLRRVVSFQTEMQYWRRLWVRPERPGFSRSCPIRTGMRPDHIR
jgi:hypothetical protein